MIMMFLRKSDCLSNVHYYYLCTSLLNSFNHQENLNLHLSFFLLHWKCPLQTNSFLSSYNNITPGFSCKYFCLLTKYGNFFNKLKSIEESFIQALVIEILVYFHITNIFCLKPNLFIILVYNIVEMYRDNQG